MSLWGVFLGRVLDVVHLSRLVRLWNVVSLRVVTTTESMKWTTKCVLIVSVFVVWMINIWEKALKLNSFSEVKAESIS